MFIALAMALARWGVTLPFFRGRCLEWDFHEPNDVSLSIGLVSDNFAFGKRDATW